MIQISGLSPLAPPQPRNWSLQPPRTVDQPQKSIHGGLSPGTCLEKPDGSGPLARALQLRQKLLDLGEPPVVDPIIKDFVGLQRPPHVVVFMVLVAIDDTDRALWHFLSPGFASPSVHHGCVLDTRRPRSHTLNS